MLSHQRVVIRKNLGIEGDRYFDVTKSRGPDRHLTLIEMENIDEFNATYGVQLSPDAPRRNVVTSGICLNDLNGKRFKIGSVMVEALELCEPCRLFKIRTDPRAIDFFMGKAGLRTRVLTDGVLEVGATIDTVV
jgi:MOSC domain-containing protein YiiM